MSWEVPEVFEYDFYYACKSNDIHKVKEILDDTHPAIDLNYIDNSFRNGLLLACAKGYEELVKLLLQDGRIQLCNNLKYLDINDALSEAIHNKHPNIVKILLDDGRIDPLEITKKWRYSNLQTFLRNGKDILDVALSYQPIYDTLQDFSENHIYGLTNLHWACLKGDLPEIRRILKEVDDPNIQDDLGRTPIFYCCINGLEDSFDEMMKDSRVNISVLGDKEDSCLYQACLYQHAGIVKKLLKDPNVDFFPRIDYGDSPFNCSCGKNNIEIVKEFLKIPDLSFLIPGDDMSKYPLVAAVNNDNIEIVKLLLADSRTDVNGSQMYSDPAIFCAQSPEVLRLLLEHPDIDWRNAQGFYSDFDPFCTYVCEGTLEILNVFLEQKNLKLNYVLQGKSEGYTWISKFCPFRVAIYNGSFDIVKRLLSFQFLKEYFDNMSNNNDFYYYCAIGDIDGIKKCLEDENCNVNCHDDKRITPLHIISASKNTELLKILLSHPNIDVNARDDFGVTPLSQAIRNRRKKNVKILLSHPNIDPNIASVGEHPLIDAASNYCIFKSIISHPKIDERLLNLNADETQNDNQNRFNKTCPLEAIIDCYADYSVIELLLNHPIADRIRSYKNALKAACSSNYYDVVVELLENQRVELDVELCKLCLDEIGQYSKKRVKYGFILCKYSGIPPSDILEKEDEIQCVEEKLNSLKTKSARK